MSAIRSPRRRGRAAEVVWQGRSAVFRCNVGRDFYRQQLQVWCGAI